MTMPIAGQEEIDSLVKSLEQCNKQLPPGIDEVSTGERRKAMRGQLVSPC
jgi:hypothetical protein